MLRLVISKAVETLWDVHDAVKAMWMLCLKPAPGAIFNVCSGTPTKMACLLDMMIRCCGRSVRVEVDSARLRLNDVSAVYGIKRRLQSTATGSLKSL